MSDLGFFVKKVKILIPNLGASHIGTLPNRPTDELRADSELKRERLREIEREIKKVKKQSHESMIWERGKPSKKERENPNQKICRSSPLTLNRKSCPLSFSLSTNLFHNVCERRLRCPHSRQPKRHPWDGEEEAEIHENVNLLHGCRGEEGERERWRWKKRKSLMKEVDVCVREKERGEREEKRGKDVPGKSHHSIQNSAMAVSDAMTCIQRK